MKTIVVKISEINENVIVLDGIMKGALSYSYKINKDTIVFNTKKEAQETLKNHSCNDKGLKYITLNKKQLKVVNIIKKSEKRYCISLENFLMIK